MAFDPIASMPAYYDDLQASLAEAWRLLVRGATDRRSAMHTPAVATVGIDLRPRVRTVVLREVDASARTLRFHTDVRAPKIAELEANPAVQVLAYDPAAKVQLRCSGRAVPHHNDSTAASAWAASQAQSQLCYRQGAAPGTVQSDPADAVAMLSEDGQMNFVAVVVEINELEWLYLAHTGHRRARFVWSNNAIDAHWLAP